MGMIRTTSRRRAATTVAAAVSALALSAPSVGAAPSAGPDQFVGRARALALDLDLTLPGGLGLSTQVGTIEQLISQTLTLLDSEGKAEAKANLLSGLLNEEPLSFTGSKKSDRREIAAQDLGIVNVRAGTMEYTADAANRVTRAFSELLDLEVGLEQTEEVEAALEDARGVLEGLVGDPEQAETAVSEGTLNDVFGAIEQQVNADLPPDAEQVDIPTIDPEQLAQQQLPDTTDLTTLASVEKLWSESITQTEAASDAIASTSKAGVVDLSLLDGLVTVPRFEFSSLAKTNGRPGGASAEAVTDKLEVQVADSPVVGINGNDLVIGGERITGLDPNQLNEVKGLLQSIVNAAGLTEDSIVQAEETEEVRADGSYAKAATSPLQISLSPLQALTADTANQDLASLNLALNLLPTLAEVSAGNVAPAPQPRPEAPRVQRPAPAQNLPRTGGGSIAGLVGALALGGAFGLRRLMK